MRLDTALAFLRYFLPLAGTIILASYFYADSHRNSARSRIEAAEVVNVRLGAGMLDRRLLIVIRDLHIAAAGSAVKRYVDSGSRQELSRVAEDFQGFSQARTNYDQIRLLDLDGQEIVRVDHRDGQAQIVTSQKLQNKADRYYFQDIIKLPPGALYLSPLDLNSEQGQIETPHTPALRIAMPLADSQGNKRALLILNYRGAEMLGYVADVTEQAADHLMVVNQDGYYLLAPNHADEWGFMLGKPELSLAHRFPQSWAVIRDAEDRQFSDDNGLWTVATVHPGHTHRTDRADMPLLNGAENQHWKVVAHIPPAALPGLGQAFDTAALGFLGLLIALSAAFAAYMARNARQKEEAETRFRIYFEHAMVGMSIQAPDKRWLAVNPALCRILGYSASELLGKSWLDMTHPEDQPASEALFNQLVSGEKNGLEMEKRYIRADGTAINARVAVQALRKADGSLDSLLTTVEDISARVTAEQAVRAGAEQLRRLGDNLPDSYLFQCRKKAGEGFRFTYLSSGTQHIHGLSPEEITADPDHLFADVDPLQLPGLLQAINDSEREQSDFSAEVRVRTPDGDWRWLQIRSRPRLTATGETTWDGVVADITARRESDALIELQSRRAHALLELPWRRNQVDEATFLHHSMGLIAQTTDSPGAFMYLVNADGMTLQLAASIPPAPDGSPAGTLTVAEAGQWADALRLRQPIIIDDYASGRAGRPEPGNIAVHRMACVPVIDHGGVQLLVGTANKADPYTLQDIETIQLMANEAWRVVRQQRAEQALRVAMAVVNASPVVFFRWQATAGWPVVFVSDNVTLWGYEVAGLLAGHPSFAEMVHPDDLPHVGDEVSRYTAEGRSDYVQEYRLLTADGRVIWVSDRTKVLRNAAGEVEYYDGVLTDITERRAWTQELTETLDAQRQLNKKLEEAHNQLLQSEKMASIGQLAAGIAHELNNPIGFVHSNLGTLESYLRDVMDIIDAYDKALNDSADNEVQRSAMAHLREARDFAYVRDDIVQLLGESKDGLARVRKIVQDLKNFSHVSEQEWQWADLHQGLDSTLNIVWNELKYKCQVVKEYGDLPKVHCLISQLNQVFMNLLVNAGHAIESKGTITIRTACRGNDEVSIEISDTGKGIAPEHLKRIFEPFFTTKPIGKGTGLGLSLSYGIIDRHHGRIEVDSQVGVGSTFRIIIPINQAASQPETSQ